MPVEKCLNIVRDLEARLASLESPYISGQMVQSPCKPQGAFQVMSELAGRTRHFEIFSQNFPYNPPHK